MTKPELFRRYAKMPFGWCTILKSPTLNGILIDANKALGEFDLNSEDYTFERYLSPKKFEIEGHMIRQFPILCVHDRDHDKWVGKFVSDNYNPAADGCSDR